MPRRGMEAGSRIPVRRRVGMDFPAFGGMHLNGDPSQVPLNHFRHLENVRFNAGGGIGCRTTGAQSDGPEHGVAGRSLQGLADFQTNPRQLFMVTDGCPVLGSAVGLSVLNFDFEQAKSPGTSFIDHLNTGVWYDEATTSVVLGVYDGKLYIGVDAVLKAFNLVIPPYLSEDMVMIGGAEQAEDIYTFSGFIITCLQEYDGKLFIGLDAGAGASKVATWDGLTIRNDTAATLNAPLSFGLWQDKLLLGYSTAASGLNVRSPGASPGTWVAEAGAIPASFNIVSYRNVAYISTGDTTIWSYTGPATLAAARTLAATTDIWCLCEFHGSTATLAADDYLIYGYRNAANAAKFGAYSVAAGWTDAAGTLPTGCVDPYCCASYRGNLFFGSSVSILGVTTAYLISTAGEAMQTMTYGSIAYAGYPGSINMFWVL